MAVLVCRGIPEGKLEEEAFEPKTSLADPVRAVALPESGGEVAAKSPAAVAQSNRSSDNLLPVRFLVVKLLVAKRRQVDK